MVKPIWILLFILFFLLSNSCDEEESIPIGGNQVTFSNTTASTVSYTTATVSSGVGSVKGVQVEQHGVCWKIAANPAVSDNKTSLGPLNEGKSFTTQLDKLTSNTTYYLRPYLTTPYETVYGAQITFTTSKTGKPKVSTHSITDITTTGAKGGGEVLSDSGLVVTNRGVVWGKLADPTLENNTGKTADGNGAGSFTSTLSGLEDGTLYYVRAYATNEKGTGYGQTLPLTTVKITLATVTTLPATNITANSAQSGGDVMADGNSPVTARGIVWGTTPEPTLAANVGKTTNGNGTGSFISQMTGLQPGTKYSIRAYTENSKGIQYGSAVEFTTEALLPSVTTAEVTNKTSKTATGGGEVTSTGGSAVSDKGIVWGLSTAPTLESNLGKVSGGSGEGSFTAQMTNLSPGTTYYVRAYAINSKGPSYGQAVSFATGATLPSVTTTTISAVLATSATGGGNVTATGGATVEACGIVWSTSPQPDINQNSGKTTNSSGTGIFTSQLTNLQPATLYFVRAYATNSQGTAYGEPVSFRTLEKDMIYDIEGNEYNVIKIGTQFWIKENLKTTKYNDGSAISNVLDNGPWSGLTTGAYCWYNNDTSNKNTYGALYNWYTVSTGKLCPTGWHVPADEEWTTLSNFLGGVSVAGGKMKSVTGWRNPNTGATNSSGFSALPGGFRYNGFEGVDVVSGWWSNSEIDRTNAWSIALYNYNANLGRGNGDKKHGFYVRCIRD